MYKTLFSIGTCVALALAGLPAAAVAQTATAPATSSHAVAKTAAGACGLLTDAEIQSVQSESPNDRKATASSPEGLAISQCYFGLPTASKSVSVSLTRRGEGQQAQDPRRQWRTLFRDDQDRDHRAHREGSEKEDEAEVPALKIAGVGDAAYWAASPVGGSLYVLKRHAYLRISVGGPGNEAEKIRKSKALARRALQRF